MKRFAAGLGLGTVLGLLFASKSGPILRRRIKQHAHKLRGSMPETVAEAGKMKRQTERSDPLLNSLSREELMEVHGIGPALAEQIVAGRPYRTDHEAVERGLIPESVFQTLKRELLRKQNTA
jgi:DNA uptake protein ComE-like DNA-binding protein